MKKIKNFTLGILGVTILSFSLYACSSDSETVNPAKEQNSDLTQRNNAQRNSIQRVKYRNFEYFFDGLTFTKTINGRFDYSLDIIYNDSFDVREIENGFQIKNDLDEDIVVEYREVGDSSIRADIRFISNGRARYFQDIELMNFPQNPRLVVNRNVSSILFIIIIMKEDNFVTACRKTVTQLAKDCAKAGGKGELTMEKGGWFSRDRCEFRCK